jgi:hypothetical protein
MEDGDQDVVTVAQTSSFIPECLKSSEFIEVTRKKGISLLLRFAGWIYSLGAWKLLPGAHPWLLTGDNRSRLSSTAPTLLVDFSYF